MNSSRPPHILFQPNRHSFPVRVMRVTVLGQILLSGLSKIWNKKARRAAAVLTAIIAAVFSGVWAAQAVAIVVSVIIVLATLVELDGCGCR